MLLARQLYFEAVKVGDELPPLVKPPVDRSQIARFAGATDVLILETEGRGADGDFVFRTRETFILRRG